MSLSFSDMALAVVSSYSGRDRSFHSRVDYWVSFFGHRDITSITTDDVEDGVDALVKRGKIKVLTTTTGVTKKVTGTNTFRKQLIWGYAVCKKGKVERFMTAGWRR